MLVDVDEGLGLSPSLSFHRRDAPTFVDDECTYAGDDVGNNYDSKFQFELPQRLDLQGIFQSSESTFLKDTESHGTMQGIGKKKKKRTKSKISPIKASRDFDTIEVGDFANLHEVSRAKQLSEIQRSRRDIQEALSRMAGGHRHTRPMSPVSDVVASSVVFLSRCDDDSSVPSSDSDQRSLAREIRRTRQLIKCSAQMEQKPRRQPQNLNLDSFTDSDFHIESLSSPNNTIVNTQPSSASSKEVPRLEYDYSWAAVPKARPIPPPALHRDAATNTSMMHTDEQLASLNDRHRIRMEEWMRNWKEEERRKIGPNLFEETPILGSVRPPVATHPVSDPSHSTSRLLEKPRREHSSTSAVLTDNLGPYENVTLGNAKGASLLRNVVPDDVGAASRAKPPSGLHGLQHSFSAMSIPTQRGRGVGHADCNLSLPNLRGFGVRKSTRDIFHEPLDIESVFGKGVRKIPNSSERMFGGENVVKCLYGDEAAKEKASTYAKTAEDGARRAQKETTASDAKRRSASTNARRPGTATTTTKTSAAVVRQPAFCSVPQKLDSTSYSLGAATQQVIGVIKLLHPDWLPLGHRLVASPDNVDVAELFRDEVYRQLKTLVACCRERGGAEMTQEDREEACSRVPCMERIIQKLDQLLDGRGRRSRVQQLKDIHFALLNA